MPELAPVVDPSFRTTEMFIVAALFLSLVNQNKDRIFNKDNYLY